MTKQRENKFENLTTAAIISGIIITALITGFFPGLDINARVITLALAAIVSWNIYLHLEIISLKQKRK